MGSISRIYVLFVRTSPDALAFQSCSWQGFIKVFRSNMWRQDCFLPRPKADKRRKAL
mgnify:FL=1|jgi:hypothetical protein